MEKIAWKPKTFSWDWSWPLKFAFSLGPIIWAKNIRSQLDVRIEILFSNLNLVNWKVSSYSCIEIPQMRRTYSHNALIFVDYLRFGVYSESNLRCLEGQWFYHLNSWKRRSSCWVSWKLAKLWRTSLARLGYALCISRSFFLFRVTYRNWSPLCSIPQQITKNHFSPPPPKGSLIQGRIYIQRCIKSNVKLFLQFSEVVWTTLDNWRNLWAKLGRYYTYFLSSIRSLLFSSAY